MRDLPIHPDTAEFLYPGLVKSLNEVFTAHKYCLNLKWWTGSILDPVIRFIKKMLNGQKQNKSKKKVEFLFPPYPFCEIGFDNPIIEGGNPVVQQKMAVYQFYHFLGKYVKDLIPVYKVVHAVLTIGITFLVYFSAKGIISEPIALVSSLILLIFLSLPLLDSFQIHAEFYGIFVLSIVCALLFSTDIVIDEYIRGFIAGFLVIVLFFFVKVTFLAEAVLLLAYPVFIKTIELIGPIIFGEIVSALVIMLSFAGTRYFTKLFVIMSPSTLLHYKKNIASMQVREDKDHDYPEEKSDDDHSRSFVRWLYTQLHNMFLTGIAIFFISGLIYGWIAFHSFQNLYGFFLLWSVISLLVVKVQEKFYAAHFIPPLIPLVFLWGITTQTVVDRLNSFKWSPLSDQLFTILMLVVISAPVLFLVWGYYRFNVSVKPAQYFLIPYIRRKNPHILPLLAAAEIGTYVKRKTTPEDRIFTFGYCNTVYIYARRRAALEFLEGSLGVDPEIADSIWADRWKWWVCRDIFKFKPKYIVDMDGRLNIDVINAATGLDYAPEKTFYHCFQVYRLIRDKQNEHFGGCENLEQMVLETSAAYERRQAFNRELFLNGMTAPESLPSELAKLMIDWKTNMDGAMA